MGLGPAALGSSQEPRHLRDAVLQFRFETLQVFPALAGCLQVPVQNLQDFALPVHTAGVLKVQIDDLCNVLQRQAQILELTDLVEPGKFAVGVIPKPRRRPLARTQKPELLIVPDRAGRHPCLTRQLTDPHLLRGLNSHASHNLPDEYSDVHVKIYQAKIFTAGHTSQQDGLYTKDPAVRRVNLGPVA